jgi:REP element-mobilizing transposase RayT
MPNHIHGIIQLKMDGCKNAVGIEYFRPNQKNDPNPQNDHKSENNKYVRPENHENTIIDHENGKYGKNIKRVENIRLLPTSLPNEKPRPNCESGTIGAIIRGFKIGVTKQLGYSVWQRNYHEMIIRNQQSYQNIANYIKNNTTKKNNDKYIK